MFSKYHLNLSLSTVYQAYKASHRAEISQHIQIIPSSCAILVTYRIGDMTHRGKITILAVSLWNDGFFNNNQNNPTQILVRVGLFFLVFSIIIGLLAHQNFNIYHCCCVLEEVSNICRFVIYVFYHTFYV